MDIVVTSDITEQAGLRRRNRWLFKTQFHTVEMPVALMEAISETQELVEGKYGRWKTQRHWIRKSFGTQEPQPAIPNPVLEEVRVKIYRSVCFPTIKGTT